MPAISFKSSAKILAIAGLVIGFSAVCFGQAGSQTSVVNTLNNQAAVNNTSPSPRDSSGGHDGGDGGHDGGSGGHDGGHDGGDGGHDGGGGGGCVPEPMSMLALGIGSGVIFLRKRGKKV